MAKIHDFRHNVHRAFADAIDESRMLGCTRAFARIHDGQHFSSKAIQLNRRTARANRLASLHDEAPYTQINRRMRQIRKLLVSFSTVAISSFLFQRINRRHLKGFIIHLKPGISRFIMLLTLNCRTKNMLAFSLFRFVDDDVSSTNFFVQSGRIIGASKGTKGNQVNGANMRRLIDRSRNLFRAGRTMTLISRLKSHLFLRQLISSIMQRTE